MTFEHFFGDAKWICATNFDQCPAFRQTFTVEGKAQDADINILGFGTFEAFLNGKKIGDDWFQPMSTDYEQRQWAPLGEQTAFRTLVPQYRVTDLLRPGENVLVVTLGNGWYSFPTDWKKTYGGMKAVWLLTYTDKKGKHEVKSSPENVLWKDSFVKYSELICGEGQDYTGWNDGDLLPETIIGDEWSRTTLAPVVKTNYEVTNCPPDRVQKIIKPKLLHKDEEGGLYDFGINTSGVPVFSFKEGMNGRVDARFSEELKGENLDEEYVAGQKFWVVNDGAARKAVMRYTWVACRYAYVTGEYDSFEFWQIHADITPTAHFESDDKTLNWLWKAYLNTQLSNIHRGIPSDCPHRERRGYTGDGQLTARVCMKSLNAYDFYDKWIRDISDCQDRITGHVQYTAPYIKSGGGPGGWGGAIVFVPYVFWKIYGDDKYLAPMYPQMLEYFRYLEDHSEYGLVTSDKPGEWCLGDWCTPDLICLPAPFVNNYFYVKALEVAVQVAHHIGKDEDIPRLQKTIDYRRDVTRAAYMNPFDGNFIGNRQGANGFALDMGIGDDRTKHEFIEHYRQEPYFDTGIFGTEIIIRLLFAYGETDTAYKILIADKPHGFGAWKKWRCTTLWEYWVIARSHSHPMFGAPVETLFTEFLGIKQAKFSVGYEAVEIRPQIPADIHSVKGYITTPQGRVSVAYQKHDNTIDFALEIPQNTPTVFYWNQQKYVLQTGKTTLQLPLKQ